MDIRLNPNVDQELDEQPSLFSSSELMTPTIQEWAGTDSNNDLIGQIDAHVLVAEALEAQRANSGKPPVSRWLIHTSHPFDEFDRRIQ